MFDSIMARKSLARGEPEWDPMREDYYDRNFNTYKQGPGARLELAQQPWSSRSDQGKGLYKLYVGHLPYDITERGIENIFLNYGEPLNIYKSPPTPGSESTWGFVCYGTHSEAEWAIRELNNKQPLLLRVQFARTDAEKERLRQEQLETEMFQRAIEQQPFLLMDRDQLYDYETRPRGTGRGRGLLQYFHPRRGDGIRPGQLADYVFNDEYVLDEDEIDSDEDYYHSSLNSGNYNSNMSLMKGISFTVDSASGDRKMSVGRGYHPISKRPAGPRKSFVPAVFSAEENIKIKEEVEKFYDRVENGRYEYGEPQSPGLVGPCNVCKKVTSSFCERCSQWYCCRDCQLADWSNHRAKCKKVPSPEAAQHSAGNQNKSPETPTNTSVGQRRDLDTTNEGHVNNRGNVWGDKARPKENNISPRDEGRGDRKSGGERGDSFMKKRNDETNTDDCQLANKSYSSHNNGVMQASEGPRKSFGQGSGGPRNKFGEQGSGGPRNKFGEQGSGGPRNKFGEQGSGGSRNTFGEQGSGGGPKRTYREPLVDSPRNSEEGPKSPRKSFGGYDGSRKSSGGQGAGGPRKNFGSKGYDAGSKNYDGPKRNFGVQDSNDGSRKSFGNQRSNTGSNENKHHTRIADEDWGVTETKAVIDSDADTTSTLKPSALATESPCKQMHSTPKPSALATKSPDKQVHSTPKSPALAAESPCKQVEELPAEFSEVKVAIPVRPMEYWVSLSSMFTSLVDIMKDLKEQCSNSSAFKPEIGAVCAAPYCDDPLWYRVCILSIAPKLKVKYIDYGNEEFCEPNLLRPLPPSAMKLPAQAIRISLAPGTSEKYKNLPDEAKLSVKPIRKLQDGSILVLVEGETYDVSPTTHTTKSSKNELPSKPSFPEKQSPSGNDMHSKPSAVEPPRQNIRELRRPHSQPTEADSDSGLAPGSIVSLMTIGMTGYFEYVEKKDSKMFSATTLFFDLKTKYDSLVNFISENAPELPEDKLNQPKVKDFVVALSTNDDCWYRGYVLSASKKGYSVAFCDSGIVEKVVQVRKPTPEYLEFPVISVFCTLGEFLKPEEEVMELFEPGGMFQYDVEKTTAEKAAILIKTVEEEIPLCKAVISRWTPPYQFNERPSNVELKNGPCLLSAFLSSRNVFVRPLNKSCSEMYNQVLQEVAGHCLSASSLDHMPKKGELLGSQYSCDGNYYRALVQNVVDDTISVAYIDFGNLEDVKLESLKPLSDKLKSYPCSAVGVVLESVPDKPLTKEAIDVLNNLVGRESELRLELSEAESNEVNLYMEDGTYINDKLNKLLEPSWKKAIAEGEDPSRGCVYLYSAMECLELPVGKTITFGVLNVASANTVMGCDTDCKGIKNMQEVLEKQIHDYCEASPKQSFVPRTSEVCLAKFQGGWYRAVCIEVVGAKAHVMFIDYGNVSDVEFTDICPMVGDIYNTPAIASICTIQGIPKEAPANLQTRLNELVVESKLLSVNVLEETSKGLYIIEIPQVIQTLQKEGLLPGA